MNKMKIIFKLIILIGLLAAYIYSAQAQTKTIIIEKGSFFDKTRNRVVPFKVYYPSALNGIYPVIIFSHGLGGSIEAASYLGEYLSENGYICFHIQHEGSDESIWQGAKDKNEILQLMNKSILKPQNAVNRFKDIPFVIDEIIKLNSTDNKFLNHIDKDNIAIAGHSYGGKSAIIAAGEKIGARNISFKESRIKSGLVLSPNLPGNNNADLDKIYSDIDIPLMHITGSKDGDPLNRNASFNPEQRTKPYEYINTSDQYLLVLKDATHMTFSGKVVAQVDLNYKKHIISVKKAALAFFDAYLKKDTVSLDWLRNSYKNTLEIEDTFEWKTKR